MISELKELLGKSVHSPSVVNPDEGPAAETPAEDLGVIFQKSPNNSQLILVVTRERAISKQIFYTLQYMLANEYLNFFEYLLYFKKYHFS